MINENKIAAYILCFHLQLKKFSKFYLVKSPQSVNYLRKKFILFFLVDETEALAGMKLYLREYDCHDYIMKHP